MPMFRDEWIIVDSHDSSLVAEGFDSEDEAKAWMKRFPSLCENITPVIMQARDWHYWDEPSSEADEYEG